MFPTRELSLRLFLAAALALHPASTVAQGGRAAALRQEASELLGGALETVAGMLPGDAPDPALLEAVDTAFDLRQRLGNAVFAVPVARQHRLRAARPGLSRPDDHVFLRPGASRRSFRGTPPGGG